MMKNRVFHKTLAFLMAGCLLLGGLPGALAQSPSPSDFEAVQPVMDLVACAVISQQADMPEAVPGSEGSLSQGLAATLMGLWQQADPSLGLTQEVAADPQKQAEFLGKVFAAQLPALEAVTQPKEINGYIGFRPVTVNSAAEAGGIQLVGEIYWAPKALGQLTDEEYTQVQWLERGIFTLQSDNTALNGFRIAGFSVGTELNMELAVQDYFDSILVEYVNTSLGFSLQYPSVFTDELLEEDEAGVSAQLPDGTASFFAKRVENVNQSNLKDYVDVIANGITGSQALVNEDFRYASVTYTTDEGFTVFDVYIVTDKYIYQAELSYRSELGKEFSMYNAYLENTFMVNEVSVG
ncbi:MAG: hypothetical protein VB099_17115 [Candidatus Limiplasma sp.]|nr:hypothetical protein [Candidatus Limiplasma sp.]